MKDHVTRQRISRALNSLLFIPTIGFAQSTLNKQAMTNQDVLEMVEAHLWRLFISFMVIALFAVSGVGQTRRRGSSTRTPSRILNDIRQIDFKNYTYEDGESKVRVRNGKWKGRILGQYFSVDKIVYGDLTGDGGDEAVVVTSNSGGGSGQFSEGIIFTIKNGRVEKLMLRERDGTGPYDGIPGGDRGEGSIYNVRIERGMLFVERYAPDPNGPPYDPAFVDTSTYRWDGSVFIPVGGVQRRRFK